MSKIFLQRLGIAGIVCVVLLAWRFSDSAFFEKSISKTEANTQMQIQKCEAQSLKKDSTIAVLTAQLNDLYERIIKIASSQNPSKSLK